MASQEQSRTEVFWARGLWGNCWILALQGEAPLAGTVPAATWMLMPYCCASPSHMSGHHLFQSTLIHLFFCHFAPALSKPGKNPPKAQVRAVPELTEFNGFSKWWRGFSCYWCTSWNNHRDTSHRHRVCPLLRYPWDSITAKEKNAEINTILKAWNRDKTRFCLNQEKCKVDMGQEGVTGQAPQSPLCVTQH